MANECGNEFCDHRECWQAAKDAVADRRRRDFLALFPQLIINKDIEVPNGK